MNNLNGITFTSWNTNISEHSYTDFGVILTEQNIGLPSPKTYNVIITINSNVYSAGTHLRAIKLTSGANTLNSSGSATLNFQEGEI